MKVILVLLIQLLSFLAFADNQEKVLSGYDPKRDIIAENYEAGAFLIYDCKEGHWTCVLESYYQECADKRKADLVAKDDPLHTCAPIGQFPTKKSCFQRILFLTSNNVGNRFCVKDSWNEKAIP
jgi:hypothetical protein